MTADRWLVSRGETARQSLSLTSTSPEIFTVIHSGDDIDEDAAREVLSAAGGWIVDAQPQTSRQVDVWGAPWNHQVSGWMATAMAFGGCVCPMYFPTAEVLVAKMRVRGLAVRYRRARQSVVDDAELRAISLGWPVRYL